MNGFGIIRAFCFLSLLLKKRNIQKEQKTNWGVVSSTFPFLLIWISSAAVTLLLLLTYTLTQTYNFYEWIRKKNFMFEKNSECRFFLSSFSTCYYLGAIIFVPYILFNYVTLCRGQVNCLSLLLSSFQNTCFIEIFFSIFFLGLF